MACVRWCARKRRRLVFQAKRFKAPSKLRDVDSHEAPAIPYPISFHNTVNAGSCIL